MNTNFELAPEFLSVSLLSFIPGLVGLAIFFYVRFRITLTSTTVLFMVFVMACSVWQIAEGFLRISANIETALFWNNIISIAITTSAFSSLHFTLLFVGNKKFIKSWSFFLLVYLPGIFFLVVFILHLYSWPVVRDPFWNWKNGTNYSALSIAELIWQVLMVAITTFHLIRFALASRNSEEYIRKRALLIGLGFMVPASMSVIFQIALPLMLETGEIPISTPAMLFFQVCCVIALKKHQLFRYNSPLVAAKIFETMDEGIIIFDTRLKVMYVNRGFCNLTGYSRSEVVETTLHKSNPFEFAISSFFQSSEDPGNFKERQEKQLTGKDGRLLHVLCNYSAYTGPDKEVIGTIVLCTDITELTKTREKINVEKRHALHYQSMLLSAQLSPHFIFNSLNSIQYYILDDDRQPALDYISRFAVLMRTVLRNSLQEFILISEEMTFLRSYIELELMRSMNKFRYEIIVCPELDAEDTVIPPMLLQPYVENAIIHGIGLRPFEGFLRICFLTEGDHIKCIIEDNGVGREKAGELNQMKTGRTRNSYGMNLVSTRIGILNEINDVNYRSEIEDLKDETGEGVGTRVSIWLPKYND